MMLQTVLAASEGVERRLARLHLRLGRPVRVHAFSGFATAEWASVGGRVLVQAQPRPATSSTSRWAVMRANLLPFLSVEVPEALMRVTLGDRHLDVRADVEGYVQATLHDVHLPPGRHTATLTPLEPSGAPATATVHVSDPAADLAVVSDVDDTIVDSGIAHGLATTLRTTLLKEQSTRVPLAGAPELYRALAHGASGGIERPFFYLSTSPWNLAGFLQGFLARHGFPEGPLVLTDWGPGADGLLRVRTRTHKLSALRRLAKALPDVRFVLIGDSGQQDAAIYAEFSREHPGRVAAIYIRRAGAPGPVSDERAEQAAQLLEGAGAPYVLAHDSSAMFRHASELGLISRTDGSAAGRLHRASAGRPDYARTTRMSHGAAARPVPAWAGMRPVAEVGGRRMPFLRWSFVRMILGMKTLTTTWQVGDGREQALADYVAAHARAGDADDAVRVIDEFCYTRKFMINVGDEKGALLDAALLRVQPRLVLELGTYCGYSALRMARALPADARIVSVEFVEANARIARRILEHAGVADRVTVVVGSLGDGGSTMDELEKRHGVAAGSVDLVFVDHDKGAYLPDLQRLIERGWLHPGTVVVADNVGFPGAPDYRAFLSHEQGRTWRTVEHSTHVEYQKLLKDLVLESEFLGPPA